VVADRRARRGGLDVRADESKNVREPTGASFVEALSARGAQEGLVPIPTAPQARSVGLCAHRQLFRSGDTEGAGRDQPHAMTRHAHSTALRDNQRRIEALFPGAGPGRANAAGATYVLDVGDHSSTRAPTA
jgi:hypothetical protein